MNRWSPPRGGPSRFGVRFGGPGAELTAATEMAVERRTPRSVARHGCCNDLMQDEHPLSVRVECYAGHRGEQTPRALILGDRRIAVAEVLDAWLAPEHRYFKLRGADGDTYLVRHDERSDTWELTMFRAETRWTAG